MFPQGSIELLNKYYAYIMWPVLENAYNNNNCST